jgi:hypothetical protein
MSMTPSSGGAQPAGASDHGGPRFGSAHSGGGCGYDAVLIVTDHDSIDYVSLAKSARLVVDRHARSARGLRLLETALG